MRHIFSNVYWFQEHIRLGRQVQFVEHPLGWLPDSVCGLASGLCLFTAAVKNIQYEIEKSTFLLSFFSDESYII